MIFAPVTASNEQWHSIKNTQAAWRNALATGRKYPTTTAAARRLAADAECELRDLWNAA